MADSIPRIYLSRTLSMVETDSIIALTDAEVKLSVNGENYYFTGGEGGVYTCEEYIPEPGDQLRIDCSSEGLPDAYAVTSINDNVRDLELNSSVDENYFFNIDLSLSDPSGITDYYEVYMCGWGRQIHHVYDIPNDTSYIDTTMVYTVYAIRNTDSIAELAYNLPNRYYSIDNDWQWGNRLVFSDMAFNGQMVNLHFTVNLLSTYNDSIPEIKFVFIKRDEAFYRFIESMISYDPNPELPVIQPIRIYSNIEGGMGLLLSAAEKSWTIDMSEYYNDPGFLEVLNGK